MIPFVACTSPEWVKTSKDSIPDNSFEAGRTEQGGKLFVGRAYHDQGMTVGKVQPEHSTCYIPYGGKEISKPEYEILVCDPGCSLTWVNVKNGHIPAGAIQGGYEKDQTPLYIGRASHQGQLAVGKIHPIHRCCYISWGGKEIPKIEFEALVIDKITGIKYNQLSLL